MLIIFFFTYKNRCHAISNQYSFPEKRKEKRNYKSPSSWKQNYLSVEIPLSSPKIAIGLVTKEATPFVFEFFTFCTEIRKRNRHPFPSSSTSRYVTTRLPPQICVTFYSSFSCEQVSHIPSCPLSWINFNRSFTCFGFESNVSRISRLCVPRRWMELSKYTFVVVRKTEEKKKISYDFLNLYEILEALG